MSSPTRSSRGRFKPSYSGVVATLALFIALGGSSYAALKLPKNSVGTREVRDHSLLASDLARGVLPLALRGPRGPEGPEGRTGANGTPGPTGPAGATSIITASRGQVELSAGGPSATDLVSLATVPAGNWWVIGSASMVWGSPVSAFRLVPMRVALWHDRRRRAVGGARWRRCRRRARREPGRPAGTHPRGPDQDHDALRS